MKTGKRLAIAIMTMLLLGGCQVKERDTVEIMELSESALEEPQTTEVIRGDIQVSYTSDAQIGPKVEQLTFPQGGSFGEYEVRLGEQVTQGQILASADVESLENAIQSKEQELENLIHNYEYNKDSLNNQIQIAQINLDRSYAQIEEADNGSQAYYEACVRAGEYDQQRKRLELLLKQLEETYELEKPHCEEERDRLKKESTNNLIRAPFDGVIVALADAEYRQGINTENDYVAVADPAVLYARCESLGISMVKNAEKIVLLLNGKTYDTEYIPRDDAYYLKMRNSDETSYAEFQVIDPQGEVQLGESGKIRYIMSEKKDVLLLPRTALMSSDGSTYVYKDVDGQHIKTIVKTGAKDDLMVEITGGLDEGDVVYVQE